VTEVEGHQQREVYFQGMVQGVGFRYTTRRIAARFNVTGYVRNLPDGRVLMVAEGPPEELDRVLAEINTQMGQYVYDTRQTVRAPTGQFSRFEIRY
jgi:acylphosphatase